MAISRGRSLGQRVLLGQSLTRRIRDTRLGKKAVGGLPMSAAEVKFEGEDAVATDEEKPFELNGFKLDVPKGSRRLGWVWEGACCGLMSGCAC